MLSTYLTYLSEKQHNVAIRPLTQSDAKDIVKLINHCFPNDKATKQKIEKSMSRSKPDLYYGAIYDNKIVGIMLVYPMNNSKSQASLYNFYNKQDGCLDKSITLSKFKPEILLQNFCVHAMFRGLKVGNKMLEFITGKYKRIFLKTDSNTSPQAYYLYKKYGFKDIDCKEPSSLFYRG